MIFEGWLFQPAFFLMKVIYMNYQEAMEKVNSRLLFGVKPGLERISALLEKLGNPQKQLKFVHVAGTNGKGTTCTLIASTLKAAGYRTGLYISPYVLEFRERFQIDGQMIPEEELIQQVQAVSAVADEMEAGGETITEFEFITAMAFRWFAERKCDIVVLEVGLGGRFDATNVIDMSEAAAVASISLDHTAVLGDTVEQIAFEKAGIIKPGGTLICYPDQQPGAQAVLEKVAEERGATFRLAQLSMVQEQERSIYGTRLLYRGEPLLMPFVGEHQVKNAVTALTTLEVLQEKGWNLPLKVIQEGFAQARIPARMEILGHDPLILLDGGHNPGCAAALRDVLAEHLPGKKLVAVMGMMSDKDSRTALSVLAPLFSAVRTLRPENPRSLSAEELAEEAAVWCSDSRPCTDHAQALQEAKELAGKDGAVIVCGSFFLAAEIRPMLLK